VKKSTELDLIGHKSDSQRAHSQGYWELDPTALVKWARSIFGTSQQRKEIALGANA
jgi:hypothetical protein